MSNQTQVFPVDLGSGISGQVVAITPGLAKAWLLENVDNRTRKQRMITQFARLMQTGDWRVAQPIMFSGSGRLIDGQNRLHAIIESGRTIEMAVLWGFPDEVQKDLDSGAKRTTGDQLKKMGVSEASLVAAILRVVWSYDLRIAGGDISAMAHTTELVDLFLREPWAAEAAKATNMLNKSGLSVNAGVGGILHRCKGLHPENTDLFIERLKSGSGLASDDPVFRLREMLLKEKLKKSSDRKTTVQAQALTIKAFNAWSRGETLRLLKWNEVGPSQEPFPRICP